MTKPVFKFDGADIEISFKTKHLKITIYRNSYNDFELSMEYDGSKEFINSISTFSDIEEYLSMVYSIDLPFELTTKV